MTDTNDAATFRASMCPEDGCHALVPAEFRQNHIDKHRSDKRGARATKDRFITLDDSFAAVKDEVRSMRRELAQIEIPEQKDPIVIEEWPETEFAEGDEDDDEQTHDAVDDWNYPPAPTSVAPTSELLEGDEITQPPRSLL